MKSKAVRIPEIQPDGPARVIEITKVQWLALGQMLRLKRREARLTQQELAKRARCSSDHISRLENGGHVLRPVLLRVVALMKKLAA